MRIHKEGRLSARYAILEARTKLRSLLKSQTITN